MQAATDTVVACTLGSDALGPRLAWIGLMTDRHLVSHRLDATVLRLTYRVDALSNLEQIVALERECCSFLSFSLERLGETVLLIVEAPEDGGADTRWLFAQFLPQTRPVASSRACGCASGTCGRPTMAR